MKTVEMAILSTDLASYFEKRERFLSTADAGEIDWQVVGDRTWLKGPFAIFNEIDGCLNLHFAYLMQ